MQISPIVDARTAVRAYRNEVMTRKDAFAQVVLGRLEADKEERVSTALRNLKPANAGLVIFYLIQAADLTKSRVEIVSKTKKLADDYRQAAQRTRELFEFCHGKTSIHLWSVLPKLAEELDKLAQFNDEQPKKLKIGRKFKNESDGQLLAIRRFNEMLRDELRIDCSGAHPRDRRQRLQRAVQHLVEAALDYTMPEGQLAEALRKPPRPRSAAVTAAGIRHSRARKPKQSPTI